MLPCCPLVVRPPFVWPRVLLPSFLFFTLLLALVVQVPVGSLLPYGSQPSRWDHPCGVEAGLLLDRNEGLVCFSFPFGLFLRVASPSGYGHHLCQVCWSVPTCARPKVVIGGIVLCASPFILLDGLRASV